MEATQPSPTSTNPMSLAVDDQGDSDSDQEVQSKATSPLSCVAPAILEELRHLDLTSRVTFNESTVICGGSYGDICKGRCDVQSRGRIRVAIKRLRFYLKEDVKMLFEKEIYVWAKLKHTNILPSLGYAFDNQTGFPLLVSEWVKNGSAWNYVSSNPQCDLMRLVLGIAQGLAYLHENDIVHSDIKSDNVLVTEAGDALICDFGCSHMLAASRTLANLTTGIRGTQRYLAYELFTSSGSRHSKESDVWAFGMTVFELLSRERPYAEKTDAQVMFAIIYLQLPSIPAELAFPIDEQERQKKTTLWNVCRLCWRHDPATRIDMNGVVLRLAPLEEGRENARGLRVSGNPLRVASKSIDSDIHIVSRLLPAVSYGERESEDYDARMHNSRDEEEYDEDDSNDDDNNNNDGDVVLSQTCTRALTLPRNLPNNSLSCASRWTQEEKIGTNKIMCVRRIRIPHTDNNHGDKHQVSIVESLRLQWETLVNLDHPNIIHYFGFESTPEFLNIFFEYTQGDSMASYLQRRVRFEGNVLRYFIDQILSGLEYLHSTDIVHQNLKPENILVNHSGICKISDFGISKHTEDINEVEMDTSMQDSVFFMAPEVVRAARKGEKPGYNNKADIWSLGCVALEMWAGCRPWQDIDAIVVLFELITKKKAPPIPPDVVLSPDADNFRKTCFAIRPVDRPSATELRQHPYLILPPSWTFTGFRTVFD